MFVNNFVICLVLLLTRISTSARPDISLDSRCASRTICFVKFTVPGVYVFKENIRTLERIVIQPRFPSSTLDIRQLANLKSVEIDGEVTCSVLLCGATAVDLLSNGPSASCCGSETTLTNSRSVNTTQASTMMSTLSTPATNRGPTETFATNRGPTGTTRGSTGTSATNRGPTETFATNRGPTGTTRVPTGTTRVHIGTPATNRGPTGTTRGPTGTNRGPIRTHSATDRALNAIAEHSETPYRQPTFPTTSNAELVAAVVAVGVIAVACLLGLIILLIFHKRKVVKLRNLQLPFLNVNFTSPQSSVRRSASDPSLMTSSSPPSAFASPAVQSPTPLISPQPHRYPTRFQKSLL